MGGGPKKLGGRGTGDVAARSQLGRRPGQSRPGTPARARTSGLDSATTTKPRLPLASGPLGLNDASAGPALVYEPETGLYRDALTDSYLTEGQLDIARQLLGDAAQRGNASVTRFQTVVRRTRLAQSGREAALLAPGLGGHATPDTVPMDRDIGAILLTPATVAPHSIAGEATTLAMRVQQLDLRIDTVEARLTALGDHRAHAALTAAERSAIAHLRARHTVLREHVADLATSTTLSDAEAGDVRLQVEQATDDVATLEHILTLPLPPEHPLRPATRAATVRVREEWLTAIGHDDAAARAATHAHLETIEVWGQRIAALAAYRTRLQAHVAPLVGVTLSWTDQTKTTDPHGFSCGPALYHLTIDAPNAGHCTGRLTTEEDPRNADAMHPVAYLRSFPLMQIYAGLDTDAQAAWDQALLALDHITALHPDAGPSDASLDLYGSYAVIADATKTHAAALSTLQAMTSMLETGKTAEPPASDPLTLSMPSAVLHDLEELRALRSGSATLAARIPPPTAAEVRTYLAATREHTVRLATAIETLRTRVLAAPTRENLLTIALLANPEAVKTTASRDAYLRTLAAEWPHEPARLFAAWSDPWIRPRRTMESAEHSAFVSDEGHFETVDSTNRAAYEAAQANEAFTDPGGALTVMQHELDGATAQLSDDTAAATLTGLADQYVRLEAAMGVAARAHVMNTQHDSVAALATLDPVEWAMAWTAAQETPADAALTPATRATRYTEAATAAQRETLRADIGTVDAAIADLDQMYGQVATYLRADAPEEYVRSLALLQQYVGAARTANGQARAAVARGDVNAAAEQLRRANAFVLQASQSPRHHTILEEYQDRIDRDLYERLIGGSLIIIAGCGLASLAAASVEGTALGLGLAEAAPTLAGATEIVTATTLIQLGNHAAFGDALPDGLSGWALEVGSFWGMSRFTRAVGQGVQALRVAQLARRAVDGLVKEGALATRAGQAVWDAVARARVMERVAQLSKGLGNRAAWGTADYAAELAAMLFLWTPVEHAARTLADGRVPDLGQVLDETAASMPHQVQLLTCLKIGNALARPWLAHARDATLKLTLGTDLAGRLTQLEQRTTAAMRSLNEVVQRDPDGTQPESRRQVDSAHRELLRLMRERQALLRHYPQLAGSPDGVTNFNRDVAEIEAAEAKFPQGADNKGPPPAPPSAFADLLHRARTAVVNAAPWLGQLEPYLPAVAAVISGVAALGGIGQAIGGGKLLAGVPLLFGSVSGKRSRVDDYIDAHPELTPAEALHQLRSELWHAAGEEQADYVALNRQVDTMLRIGQVAAAKTRLNEWANELGWEPAAAERPVPSPQPLPVTLPPPPTTAVAPSPAATPVDRFVAAHPGVEPRRALTRMRLTLWERSRAEGCEDEHVETSQRINDAILRGKLDDATTALNRWAQALDTESAAPAVKAADPTPRVPEPTPPIALPIVRAPAPPLAAATPTVPRVEPPPARPAPASAPAPRPVVPSEPLAPSRPESAPKPAPPTPAVRADATLAPTATTASRMSDYLESRIDALERVGLKDFAHTADTLMLDFRPGADLGKAITVLDPNHLPPGGRVVIRVHNKDGSLDSSKTVMLSKGRTEVKGFGNGDAREIVATAKGDLAVELPNGGRIHVSSEGGKRRIVITSEGADPSAPLRTAIDVASHLSPEQLRGASVRVEAPTLTPEITNALGALTRKALWSDADKIAVNTNAGPLEITHGKGYVRHYAIAIPPAPRKLIEPLLFEYLTYETSQAIGIAEVTDSHVSTIRRLWDAAMQHTEAYHTMFTEKEARTNDPEQRTKYAMKRAALAPYLDKVQWHRPWIKAVAQLRDYVANFSGGDLVVAQSLQRIADFSESPGGKGHLGETSWRGRATGDNAFEWVRILADLNPAYIDTALKDINDLLGPQPTATGAGAVHVHGAPVGIIYKALNGDHAARAEYNHLQDVIKECAATPGSYRITIPPEDRVGRELVPEWVVQSIGTDGQVTGHLTVETKNLDATQAFGRELAKAFRQISRHQFMDGRGAEGDGLVILTFRDGSGQQPLSSAGHRDALIAQVLSELNGLRDESASPEESARWARVRHVKIVVRLPNGSYENTILSKRQGKWYATWDTAGPTQHVAFDSGRSWRESTAQLLGW